MALFSPISRLKETAIFEGHTLNAPYRLTGCSGNPRALAHQDARVREAKELAFEEESFPEMVSLKPNA
jgi:hypothetical protein